MERKIPVRMKTDVITGLRYIHGETKLACRIFDGHPYIDAEKVLLDQIKDYLYGEIISTVEQVILTSITQIQQMTPFCMKFPPELEGLADNIKDIIDKKVVKGES